MGFKTCWVAVRGRAPASVLELLGLEPTGETCEVDEYDNHGVQLASGFYLVTSNTSYLHPDAVTFVDYPLLELSADGAEVVAFTCNDTVMFSVATCWVDGQQRWEVTRDCEAGLGALDLLGQLPDGGEAIIAGLRAKQEGVTDVDHVYDAPAELAKLLVGHRHDHARADEASNPFAVLRRTR